MLSMAVNPTTMIKAHRKITGISAIVLPYTSDGRIDWKGFTAHVARTADAGLTPAINMDTGYVNLLDEATREAVLRQTQQTLGGRSFVAGAYVADQPGALFDLAAYVR